MTCRFLYRQLEPRKPDKTGGRYPHTSNNQTCYYFYLPEDICSQQESIAVDKSLAQRYTAVNVWSELLIVDMTEH